MMHLQPYHEHILEAYTSLIGAAQNSEESIRLQIWKRDTGLAAHDPPTANKVKWLDYSYSWNQDDIDTAPQRRGDFSAGNVPYFNIEPPLTMSCDAWYKTLCSIRTGIGLLVSQDENEMRNNIQNTLQDEVQNLRDECYLKLAKIKELCGEIVVLEETIADRERKLGIMASVTAPIRRLPSELLTRILRFTLPSCSSKPSIRQPPLALCRVSKLWRDTVVNDPQMWSHIWCHFPVEGAPDKEYNKISRALEYFSHRSGTTPLNLNISEYRSTASENRTRITQLLETLYPRCRVLDFDMKGPCANSILKDIPLNAFPSLESLHLDRAMNVNTLETQIFSNCPLRHYRLSIFTPLDLANISVPRHRLETFDLVMSVAGNNSLRDTIQSWRSFMHSCSNLRTANIKLEIWRMGAKKLNDGTIWDSPLVPTSTTSLTELTLTIAFEASASTLLRGMDFPALELLHLGHLGGVKPGFSFVPEGADLAETIARDMPYITELTTLCLSRLKICNKDLRTLLSLTQRLERLSVFEMRGTMVVESEDLVSFLSIDEHESKKGFCPPLLSLRVLALYSAQHSPTEPIPHSAYANLVRSRYRWMKESRTSAGSESAIEPGTHAGGKPLPFKFLFTVKCPKDTKEYYETIKETMESEFEDLPRGVLRVDHCQLEYPPLPEEF
ncbi:unnamed protein product [Cyclocybe aegerita]|uniref:F-box domain-containing protein n=1 Tax=Cyclocybe aegerita TaxID=1973307 RepID=A0A8S0WG87_CYCAE|nr:unnamed protein product [Cyclocybe aegerita]